MASKVYYMNLKTRPYYSLLDKLEDLVKAAGIADISFAKKFTAIKIHFGEPGNLAYIRPNYARRMVELIRNLEGIPFLTDANTLYKGRRSNAVDHLESAMENGFNPIMVNCPVIIADGLKGTDYREIELNMTRCKTAKIGTAIAEADIVISMNHFKGHEMTGFGGALKNLGMGSASIGGKLFLHSDSKPNIARDKCVGCRKCYVGCNHGAICMDSDKKAVIDYDKCVGCGQCIAVCIYGAAQNSWETSPRLINEKIAEYTAAVLKEKPHFHINFIMNVSPDCDCWNTNDMAIVPDIGIMASFDPVAIDQASADLVNQAPVIAGSRLENAKGNDHFHHIHPGTDWQSGLEHAEKIGLGSRQYELVRMDKA